MDVFHTRWTSDKFDFGDGASHPIKYAHNESFNDFNYFDIFEIILCGIFVKYPVEVAFISMQNIHPEFLGGSWIFHFSF